MWFFVFLLEFEEFSMTSRRRYVFRPFSLLYFLFLLFWLLDLNKIAYLGVPSVSIGGAGTFDGIYLTGLMSVLLITLLI